MSKRILKTIRMPMRQRDQAKIWKSLHECSAAIGDDRLAIFCQPLVCKSEWQIAILSPDLYAKIQAILDEAKK